MSQKLLTISKTESQTENTFEIVYIGPAVERAIRMLSATAAQSSVTIDTDLSGDSSILVMEDDLYQIVFNLIENGIKYNRKNGTLTVKVHRLEDNAVLTVTDTGVGIPEQSLPHIFDRFYRVDKARSRSTGGAGLGLSIVKSLVERNNGTIRADSTPGQGTTFTVEFPIFDTEEPYESDQLEC
jgi:signal transduction histidine kinase